DGTATLVLIGNNGQLITIGPLNIGPLNQSGDFDIDFLGNAFITFNNQLFIPNLVTGQGTLVGAFPAGVQVDGIAIAPPVLLPGVPFIVTGPGAGPQPDVRAFGVNGSLAYFNSPFGANFQNGIPVAPCDINFDGLPDLVVGSGGGDSRVKVISGLNGSTLRDFQAFPGLTSG